MSVDSLRNRQIPNLSLTGVTRVFRHSYDGNLSFSFFAPIMFIVVFVLSDTAKKSPTNTL